MVRKYEPRNTPVRPEPSERRKAFSYELPNEGQLFYKYQNPNLHSLYSLGEAYFWFSLKNQLNDPHELKTKCQETATDEEIISWAKRLVELDEVDLIGGRDNLDNIINNLNGEIERCRDYWFRSLNSNMDAQERENKIFCASDNYESPAMWAHYTNNYTGWVIEFDPFTIFEGIPVDVWFKIKYKDELPILTLADMFENMEYQHLLFWKNMVYR